MRIACITFIRKNNGWYHPANDNEHEKLAAAGFIRSQGSALVIAPDGRLKAWRADSKLLVLKNAEWSQHHSN